jgi:hypothetical protein
MQCEPSAPAEQPDGGILMSCDSMATVEVLRLGRDRSYSWCDAHAECELRKERERLNEGASIERKD